jgi:hypothetical protein
MNKGGWFELGLAESRTSGGWSDASDSAETNERRLRRLMNGLESLVEQLEDERSLPRSNQLRLRLEALDRLETYREEIDQKDFGGDSHDAKLYRRAQALCKRLEAANLELYRSLRDEIKRGAGRNALSEWVGSARAMDGGIPIGVGYDYLDDLISGVLEFDQPDAGRVAMEPEMVPYQPTPARHIFSLIGMNELDANDVLIDLGCGLGHVPLLVSICTDARSVGIELEPAYVECGRYCAEKLNLKQVTFIERDVREADLSGGTVFYLYTPFRGGILCAVLESLRREAKKRPIRICTLGPCADTIAEEPWLEAAATPRTDRITLFRSRC